MVAKKLRRQAELVAQSIRRQIQGGGRSEKPAILKNWDGCRSFNTVFSPLPGIEKPGYFERRNGSEPVEIG